MESMFIMSNLSVVMTEGLKSFPELSLCWEFWKMSVLKLEASLGKSPREFSACLGQVLQSRAS
jgi:hypothetical protein